MMYLSKVFRIVHPSLRTAITSNEFWQLSRNATLGHLLFDLEEFRCLTVSHLETRVQGPTWNDQDVSAKGLCEAVKAMCSNIRECFPEALHGVETRSTEEIAKKLFAMRLAQQTVAHDTGLLKKDQMEIKRIYDAMKEVTKMIASATITNRAGDQLIVRRLAEEFLKKTQTDVACLERYKDCTVKKSKSVTYCAQVLKDFYILFRMTH